MMLSLLICIVICRIRIVHYRTQRNMVKHVNRNLIQMISSNIDSHNSNCNQFPQRFLFALRRAVYKLKYKTFVGLFLITPFQTCCLVLKVNLCVRM